MNIIQKRRPGNPFVEEARLPQESESGTRDLRYYGSTLL